jgi:hypothetical protein
MFILVIIGALVACPLLVSISILYLAVGLVGTMFTLPFGGAFLILGGAIGGLTPGGGMEARRYIDANAGKILFGPLIWAFDKIGPMWANFADFVMGPGGGPPPSRPPRRPNRALPPGRSSRARRSNRALPPGRW